VTELAAFLSVIMPKLERITGGKRSVSWWNPSRWSLSRQRRSILDGLGGNDGEDREGSEEDSGSDISE
jgi:hypothetical protein